LSTDVRSPVRELIQSCFDRWQIEVNHRDEKTILSVEQGSGLVAVACAAPTRYAISFVLDAPARGLALFWFRPQPLSSSPSQMVLA